MNFTPTLIPWGIMEQQHILWATYTEFAKANLNFKMDNFGDCICFSLTNNVRPKVKLPEARHNFLLLSHPG